jgi:ubiquinone/menaquinone biosynthesis C-methylase UbiE
MPHGWTKDYNHAERLLWQDASQVLSEIGIAPGVTMADIGCGDGFFSIPAARMVGETGLIYALDESTEAIASLKEKAAASGLTNLRPVIANAEKTVLCRHCADVVLMANVLHDFEEPLKALLNAHEILKPGGTLADLDWKKEAQYMHGPPFSKRLSQENVSALLSQAGFKIVKSLLSGPFHYLLLASPE